VGRGLLVSLWLKGINGAAELLLAAALLTVSPVTLDRVASRVTEAGTSPGIEGYSSRVLGRGLRNLTGSAHAFVLFYLVSHGVLKVLLVYGMLAGIKGFRPLAIAMLAALIAFMSFHWARHPSWIVPPLILWDLYILVSIAREPEHPSGSTQLTSAGSRDI